MKFGSWVYGESFLNLSLYGPEGFILEEYAFHAEWELISTNATHSAKYYVPLADTYATLTFSMTLTRNSGLLVKLILLPMGRDKVAKIGILVLFWGYMAVDVHSQEIK